MLAAILAEETRANARAIKALTATGHAMSPAAKAKMFLPTATYLVSRGPLLVGAPLGIMAGLNYYNKLRDEGQAPKARDLLHASPKALLTLPTKQQLKDKWQGHIG